MKKFWKSKTLWGALIAFIPGVGVPLSAIIMGAESGAPMPAELAILVAAAGTIWTVYGRYKSTGQLTLK